MPLMVARGEGGWKKVKRLSTNWLLPISHENVKYSIGNGGVNIVVTMYGARAGT